MLPEELARIKIDKQLQDSGWDIVSRMEYIPNTTSAVKEALMKGSKESDYLLFVEDKAIAVVEAKKEDNMLGEEVALQAEKYAATPQNWYGLWFPKQIPLVYLANGKKLYFKNMLEPDSDYIEIPAMHTPKQMLKLIGKTSEFGALPHLNPVGLRDCQYDAEIALENSFKEGKKKALAVLATGSGKTYLACLASYRLLNYVPNVKRILFLVDRNNLAKQTKSEFSQFDRTENGKEMSSLYEISRHLAATGARVSELIQIKVEHVFKGYFDLYSKGGKLRRLYIPKTLKTETEAWLKDKGITSGYLFLNRFGERITVRGISQQLKNYANKYGLNPKVVYPHSFRHRFAKNFLDKYNDISLLADLMGHESIETTRIYLRKTASEQQEIVDKIVTW